MKYNIDDETFGTANKLERFYELSDGDFMSALIRETKHWSLFKKVRVWMILNREPWKSELQRVREILEASPAPSDQGIARAGELIKEFTPTPKSL